MRSDFDPTAMSARDFYRLLTAVVVPRPIAWVSSVSPEGVDNLAPHSFFTVASTDPPIVQFTSVGEKDTLRNITGSGEFVVNLAPAALLESTLPAPISQRMSASSTPPASPGSRAARWVPNGSRNRWRCSNVVSI